MSLFSEADHPLADHIAGEQEDAESTHKRGCCNFSTAHQYAPMLVCWRAIRLATAFAPTANVAIAPTVMAVPIPITKVEA
jgi:hypothetical protein